MNIYTSPNAKKSGLRPAVVSFGEYMIFVPEGQVGVEPALLVSDIVEAIENVVHHKCVHIGVFTQLTVILKLFSESLIIKSYKNIFRVHL